MTMMTLCDGRWSNHHFIAAVQCQSMYDARLLDSPCDLTFTSSLNNKDQENTRTLGRDETSVRLFDYHVVITHHLLIKRLPSSVCRTLYMWHYRPFGSSCLLTEAVGRRVIYGSQTNTRARSWPLFKQQLNIKTWRRRGGRGRGDGKEVNNEIYVTVTSSLLWWLTRHLTAPVSCIIIILWHLFSPSQLTDRN